MLIVVHHEMLISRELFGKTMQCTLENGIHKGTVVALVFLTIDYGSACEGIEKLLSALIANLSHLKVGRAVISP